ncbi:MAG: 16S rRNA (adenine(1518)-N(6)/adenine(1519)-N(6))-dimethyltransferase RsmA [Coriobacteriales bacterium]|jgi:16S rRNA (adenine1518-N6/adenine1519-N6)-dimethyltransferase|nr:16S rRNA (adenine(1518)-N(6)/adenine(1519)-N(6))-dimethyltransferase RsmA [Coriobacteriales bacterium]
MTSYSSLASVRATRERLAELGLFTKKHLGQHFLIDDGVVGKILRLAALPSASKVLEIGPGIGTLTEALLAQQVQLTAVELDDSLLEGLRERFASLELIGGDALAPETLMRLQQLAPCALVANLPYAVAATLLLEYFQMLPSLEQATVMVQREVAERIAAKPGSKDYGAYTVKLGLLTRMVEQFKVSPQSFFPPPRVDSTVVRLERRDAVAAPESALIKRASMLADAAFFQRRKTIKNSMQAYFVQNAPESGVAVEELLQAAAIDPKRRGETLSLEDFLALASEQQEIDEALIN